MKKINIAQILFVIVALCMIRSVTKAQTLTGAPVKQKSVKDFPHTGEPPMPEVKAALDVPLRDAAICVGGDGYFYLTGTIGPDFMVANEGIKLWRSKDLKNWDSLGLVWDIEKDGTWQKQWTSKNGHKRRAVWAPELHYINGNYYLAYCITGLGTGLLKSESGKPEGPYKSVNTPDAPLTRSIDASLFQDDDGQVYFLYGSGMIARMNKDMTALIEQPVPLKCAVADNDIDHHHPNRPCKEMDHVGFEGVFLFKKDGKYYLSCAERYYERYHCMTAEADHIMGPYSARYVSVPYAGHNTFFKDAKGQWYSTMFGNDPDAPVSKKTAVVPVIFDKDGHIQPKVD